MPKIIVYFSRAGENYVSGALKMLDVGNTQKTAEILREITGADIFRIEPVQPYSDSYNECIEQAKQDNQNNARPALKALPDSLDGYDTIYLGYPNYWGTMPMCVFTFWSISTLAGKQSSRFAPTRAATWEQAKAI